MDVRVFRSLRNLDWLEWTADVDKCGQLALCMSTETYLGIAILYTGQGTACLSHNVMLMAVVMVIICSH